MRRKRPVRAIRSSRIWTRAALGRSSTLALVGADLVVQTSALREKQRRLPPVSIFCGILGESAEQAQRFLRRGVERIEF